MKILRAVLLTALALLLSLSLIACPYPYETVMQYKDTNLPEDVYHYWLSCYRAQFWGREDTAATLREQADLNIRKSLIAAGIFDALGLSLNTVAERQIAAAMERLVASAGGTREDLDTLAAAYGIGYDGLKIAVTYEQKAAALRQYLFGEGGVYSVSESEKSDFYKENYARVQMIYIPYVNFVLDDDGNRVFNPQTGSYEYESKSGAEIAAQKEKAAAVRAAAADGMDEKEFLDLMKLYNEDKSAESYPNGYYFTRLATDTSYIQDLPAAATDMKIGEMREVKSEYGVHFLLRLAPEDGGYSKAENADFFENFDTFVMEQAFFTVISSELKNVTAHEAKNGIRYEDTEPNFDLYWG
jgi:hypothetical protein